MLFIFFLITSWITCYGAQFDGFKESVCLDESTWIIADDGNAKIYLAVKSELNHIELYPIPFSQEISSQLQHPGALGLDPVNKYLYIMDDDSGYFFRVKLNQTLIMNPDQSHYLEAESVLITSLNSDIASPKKMVIDPSGKYLFLSDQSSYALIVVGNLHLFPDITPLTVLKTGLSKPHGMAYLQVPLDDPSAEYRIGTEAAGSRDYRRDVLFVANMNCISYVNTSSAILRNVVLNYNENYSDDETYDDNLQVANCTYDLAPHYNYTKVAIMAIHFQDEGQQLLSMSKSHDCDFFSLQSEITHSGDLTGGQVTSFMTTDAHGHEIVTPSKDVIVRANETECPSESLDGHPHGMTCDFDGKFCLISEPGENGFGNLANLTWTSDDLSEITSISYTNYSNISSARWYDIISNVGWSNITQLKPVVSDMFDEVNTDDVDMDDMDDDGHKDSDFVKLTSSLWFQVLLVLFIVSIIAFYLFRPRLAFGEKPSKAQLSGEIYTESPIWKSTLLSNDDLETEVEE